MELDKYLTEATAEETAKKQIKKKSVDLQKNLKKLDTLMKAGEFDKASNLYRTEILFTTRSIAVYFDEVLATGMRR